MKAGDIIRCGSELGTILSIDYTSPHTLSSPWCEVFWQDGEVEGIELDDIDETITPRWYEIISESR